MARAIGSSESASQVRLPVLGLGVQPDKFVFPTQSIGKRSLHKTAQQELERISSNNKKMSNAHKIAT